MFPVFEKVAVKQGKSQDKNKNTDEWQEVHKKTH
jgi:hypothetical protein